MTDDDKILEFFGWRDAPGLGLISPEGEDYVPPIDLNFLFEYTLSKLKEELPKLKLIQFFGDWLTDILFRDKDPVVAFKQALIKVIDDKDTDRTRLPA